MDRASAASRVYQSSRRQNEEKEFAGGCVASVTPTEIQEAKGRYYFVGRNEDPLASRSNALIELSRSVLNRVSGAMCASRKEMSFSECNAGVRPEKTAEAR